jgi:hypothetical protein
VIVSPITLKNGFVSVRTETPIVRFGFGASALGRGESLCVQPQIDPRMTRREAKLASRLSVRYRMSLIRVDGWFMSHGLNTDSTRMRN